MSAYQVNRSEFSPLLDSQMTAFGFELARAQAVAGYYKALAEIDFLTGRSATDAAAGADTTEYP